MLASAPSTLKMAPLPPPDADFEAGLGIAERHMLDEAQHCSAVGTPDQVQEQMQAFVRQTGVDELMLNGNIYDHRARLRSFEIAIGAAADIPAAVAA